MRESLPRFWVKYLRSCRSWLIRALYNRRFILLRASFRRVVAISALLTLCGGFQSFSDAQVTVIRHGKAYDPAGGQWYLRGAHSSARNEWYVAYANKATNPNRIEVLRLAEDGLRKPADASPRIIGVNGGVTPDIAYNSTRDQFLVVWSQAGNIVGRYLDATGHFIPGSGQFVIAGQATFQSFVRVAYNPTNDNYLVVWEAFNPGKIQKLMVPGNPFVAPFGTGVSLLEVQNSKNLVPNSPDVAWNAATNRFMVAWVTIGPAIKGQIFNGDGTASSGIFVVANIDGADRRPQVAANSRNGEFFIAFDTGKLSDTSVYGVIWSSNATRVKALFPIARTAGRTEWRPHAAYNEKADAYFVTYTMGRGCGGHSCDDILGKMIGTDGTLLSGIVEVSGPRAGDITYENHGIEDGLNTWGGLVSSSTKPLFLELYLEGGPKGTGSDGVYTSLVSMTAGTQVVVDTPVNNAALVLPFTVSGWAIDTSATSGTGVDKVDVWARPTSGDPAIFLGSAALGGDRPDVGAIFGSQFNFSGFSLTVSSSLSDRAYNITVHARSSVSGEFETQQTVPVTIGPDPRMALDTPARGSLLSVPFIVSGWAVGRAAPSGTGVDKVDVWAIPVASGAPVFLGAAALGGTRGDVAALLGESRFTPSGFSLTVHTPLAPGNHRIQAYARSTVTGTFNRMVEAEVTVQLVPNPWLALDTPAPVSIVTVPFNVSGWAIDRGSFSGTGVDKVDVWAFPSSGRPPIFLGSATLGGSRPDVAALFSHSRFTPCGYTLSVTDLAVGHYTLVVYARSTVTGTFNNHTSASITVQPLVSDPLMALDTPTTGSVVAFPFTVQGWAIDRGAPSGTGVDKVDVWAFPQGGGFPIFLGTAAYGVGRPDVAAVFGDPRFTFSGYNLEVNRGLPSGRYTITAFARSTVTGTFNNLAFAAPVTVP